MWDSGSFSTESFSAISFDFGGVVVPPDGISYPGRDFEHKRITRNVEKVVRSAHTAKIERIAARKNGKAEKLEARRAIEREQEIQLFNESALLTEQIKQEIARLRMEAGTAFANADMIAGQIEFMQMQIEELDVAFCMMMIAGID